jgi:hypothetical protein
MAWMIKAGNGKMGQGGNSLSIVSNDGVNAGGWRFVSTPCHYPTRHSPSSPPGSKQAWQDVLVQLTA